MNRLIFFFIFLCLPGVVFSQGTWKYLTRADGLPGDTVVVITQDKNGAYWFVSYQAGMNKLDTNGVWSPLIVSADTAEVGNIVFDSLNTKWFRVTHLKTGYHFGDYVVKFDDSSFTYYSPTGYPEPQYEPHLGGLAIDAEGHIWCGTNDKLAYWFDGTVWHPHYVPGAWGELSWIGQITTDRYGKLYFAHDRGISTLDEYIFDGGRFIGTMTHSIAFDRQNRMWFGCTHDQYALGMFDGQNWHGFTTADGLKQNDVIWVAVDSSNNIWIIYGNVTCGVSRFDGHTFTHFTTENGLADNRISSMYVDRKGYIWFGTFHGISILKDTTSSVKEKFESNAEPNKFMLFQNYPNPFNVITTITYQLVFIEKVSLSIYNLMGKEVIKLIDKQQTVGSHQVVWNGKDTNGEEVSSGIYLAVLKSDDLTKVTKLTLIR